MRIRVTLHDQIDADVIKFLKEKSNGGPLSLTIHRVLLECRKQAESLNMPNGSHLPPSGHILPAVGPDVPINGLDVAESEPLEDFENEEISEESVIEAMKAWEKTL